MVKFLASPEEARQPHRLTVIFNSPNGEPVEVQEHELTADGNPRNPEDPSGVSVLINVGLRLQDEGRHAFVVQLDGRTLRTLPLYVNLAEQPAEGAEA